jgi:peptidoglycan/xylan/chitin deacetylase (PgdA/CDA1 family)
VECAHRRLGRRAFLGLLGVGLAVSGCAGPLGTPAPGAHRPGGPADRAPGEVQPAEGQPAEGEPAEGEPGGGAPGEGPGQVDLVPGRTPPAPVAQAGGGLELHGGPAGSVPARQIALTVDDGFCAGCVTGYVEFVQRSGVHLTFSPNGLYQHAWAPHAAALRPLIAAGQIQIMNHTFNHPNLTRLPAGTIRQELTSNEAWIHRTFDTSTRPYFRPPYGFHNAKVDQAAASEGFNRTMLWDGSYSDSKLITPQFLLGQARKYLTPGVVLLGHANHPTVLGLFDQILDLIKQRELNPVTLDEMFRTHRPPTTG